VLRHASEARVLALRSDRVWKLPRVSLADAAQHATVGPIVDAFERRLGTRPWLVRRLAFAELPDDTFFELELRDRDWTPPAHGRWIGRDEMRRAPMADAQRGALDAYLTAFEHGDVPARRPPWARPGWLAGVRSWLEREGRRLGFRVMDVEQVKHWSISSVLRVETDGADLFVKAPARLPLFVEEGAVTARLAARFPGYAPVPLALEPEHGWFLLEEFPEVLGWDASPAARADVFRRFAALQRRTASLTDELLADGCLDRRLEVLARQIVELVAAGEATRRLTGEEVAELHASTPKLVELCGRLDACGLPATLVHGDLHTGNVARIDGVIAYYDWTDACVAHPFVDLQSLAWEQDERTRSELLEAYLEPWRGAVTDARLDEAVALARAVIPLHHAVSYWHIAANLEPQARPELDATHGYLREALEQARKL
jgi:hypothetical protein